VLCALIFTLEYRTKVCRKNCHTVKTPSCFHSAKHRFPLFIGSVVREGISAFKGYNSSFSPTTDFETLFANLIHR